MRIFSLLLLLGIGFTPVVFSQTKSVAIPAKDPCPRHSKLDDEQKYKDFLVRTYVTEDLDGCVRILRNNRIVFSKHISGKPTLGNDIYKGDSDGDYHPPVIPIGTDITGLGKPDLIVEEWSGGAHCCFTFYIVELVDKPRIIATIYGEDSDYSHFEDVDRDGIYEFIGWDFTFEYWHASFLGSPSPKIILRRKGTSYVLAPDLMRQPPPSPTELSKMESKVQNAKWEEGYPPPLLWGTMLDLIYTGHSDMAGNFLNNAWPIKYRDKKEFLKEFCQQLAKSYYFPGLRPTISNSPCNFNITIKGKQ